MSVPAVAVPRFPLSSTELGKWSRFAIKGGIGKATANEDRIADQEGELMFITGDELTILVDLGTKQYIVS